MKIACTSDTHGFLPEIPECDLFLHAGDICPTTNHKVNFQSEWIRTQFNSWLKRIPAKHKVIIWGNHDFIGEEIPNIKQSLDCHVLTNGLVEIEGLKIYGSPWTKRFFDWAFNMKPRELYKLHTTIPKCDIILTHGPPYGYTDLGYKNFGHPDQFQKHEGSPGLLRKIREIKPKLVCFGHFHYPGIQTLDNTIIANVSYVNNKYRPCNPPVIIEL